MGSPAPDAGSNAQSADSNSTDTSNTSAASNSTDTNTSAAGSTGGDNDAQPVSIPDAPDRSNEDDNANDDGSTDGDAEPGKAGEPITRD